MTQAEFLSINEVNQFTDFLAAKWQAGLDFKLSIYRRGKRKLVYKDLTSIKDAFLNYQWYYSFKSAHILPKHINYNGSTYDESNALLEYAQNCLIKQKQLCSDNDIRKGLELVLKWGGVYRKGNRNFVENVDNNLKDYFKNAISLWNYLESGGSLDCVDGYIDGGIISNAGFTKIYSLLFANFIIYDSRVSVALAYFMDIFFEGKIPEPLRFYIPPSRVADKSKRVVSPMFNQKQSKPHSRHFKSNAKASWLLTSVVNKLPEEICLRQLEAAMFMIGYDVRPKKYKI